MGSPYRASGKIALWGCFESFQKIENLDYRKPTGRICVWEANGTLSQLDPWTDIQQNSIWTWLGTSLAACANVECSLASSSSGSLARTSLPWPTACSKFDLLSFPALTLGWAPVAITISPWFLTQPGFWSQLLHSHIAQHSVLSFGFSCSLICTLASGLTITSLVLHIGIQGLDPRFQIWT